MDVYDVAVIGTGPGGYVAAIRAAQRGAKVLAVEQAELGALEARGRDQDVPEIEEVERGHGFENVDLLNQDALDLDDAPAAQDRLPERFLRDRGSEERGPIH